MFLSSLLLYLVLTRYQWHSTLTSKDEKWLIDALRSNLKPTHHLQGLDYADVEFTRGDFIEASMSASKAQGVEPKAWRFGG